MLESLVKAVEINPSDASATRALLEALEQPGDPRLKASTYARAAKAILPFDPIQASEHLEKGLLVSPSERQIWEALVAFFRHRGNIPAATRVEGSLQRMGGTSTITSRSESTACGGGGATSASLNRSPAPAFDSGSSDSTRRVDLSKMPFPIEPPPPAPRKPDQPFDLGALGASVPDLPSPQSQPPAFKPSGFAFDLGAFSQPPAMPEAFAPPPPAVPSVAPAPPLPTPAPNDFPFGALADFPLAAPAVLPPAAPPVVGLDLDLGASPSPFGTGSHSLGEVPPILGEPHGLGEDSPLGGGGLPLGDSPALGGGAEQSPFVANNASSPFGDFNAFASSLADAEAPEEMPEPSILEFDFPSAEEAAVAEEKASEAPPAEDAPEHVEIDFSEENAQLAAAFEEVSAQNEEANSEEAPEEMHFPDATPESDLVVAAPQENVELDFGEMPEPEAQLLGPTSTPDASHSGEAALEFGSFSPLPDEAAYDEPVASEFAIPSNSFSLGTLAGGSDPSNGEGTSTGRHPSPLGEAPAPPEALEWSLGDTGAQGIGTGTSSRVVKEPSVPSAATGLHVLPGAHALENASPALPSEFSPEATQGGKTGALFGGAFGTGLHKEFSQTGSSVGGVHSLGASETHPGTSGGLSLGGQNSTAAPIGPESFFNAPPDATETGKKASEFPATPAGAEGRTGTHTIRLFADGDLAGLGSHPVAMPPPPLETEAPVLEGPWSESTPPPPGNVAFPADEFTFTPHLAFQGSPHGEGSQPKSTEGTSSGQSSAEFATHVGTSPTARFEPQFSTQVRTGIVPTHHVGGGAAGAVSSATVVAPAGGGGPRGDAPGEPTPAERFFQRDAQRRAAQGKPPRSFHQFRELAALSQMDIKCLEYAEEFADSIFGVIHFVVFLISTQRLTADEQHRVVESLWEMVDKDVDSTRALVRFAEVVEPLIHRSGVAH